MRDTTDVHIFLLASSAAIYSVATECSHTGAGYLRSFDRAVQQGSSKLCNGGWDVTGI